MAVKKDKNKWTVDIYPNGRNGKRIRKKFDTKLEAQRFEKYVLNKAFENKDWNISSTDSRKLSELIGTWYQVHGQHLNYSKRRLNLLNYAATAMGDPVARKLTPEMFLRYREQRINDGISPKAVNNMLGYLNAVFNELYRNEIIDYENPLGKVRPIKIKERELSYLDHDQITELFNKLDRVCINPHVKLIAKICLSTGCRWGEAQSLHGRNVRNGKITFTDTKSGKNRTVPISKELQAEIRSHGDGQLFTNSEETFRRTLRMCSFEVPKGQATHILRHTFASWFMINGGNILTLQRILGHSSITMTMRYAHLAPDHLQEAIALNPLTRSQFVDKSTTLTAQVIDLNR